jgi:tRNA pseudouridine55 synthase
MNGWINIYKPKGYTSTYCLNVIKSKFKLKKIGHAGTLDPLAEGILPVAIDEATKSIPYLSELKKTYFFEAVWGKETSTLDAEGEVTHSSEIIPSKESIKKKLNSFVGTIEQVPPRYSAKKINGERCYNLARNNQTFDLKAQKIQIYNIKIVAHGEGRTSFLVHCGLGTYVRSLIRDIAYSLNTFGYASKIVRRRYGQFTQKSSLNMDFIIKKMEKKELQKYLLEINKVLIHIPSIKLEDKRIKLIKNGMKVSMLEEFGAIDLKKLIAQNQNQVLAFGELKSGFFYPKKILNI